MKIISKTDVIVLSAIIPILTIGVIFYLYPVPEIINRRLTGNRTIINRCLASNGIQYEITTNMPDRGGMYYDTEGNLICHTGSLDLKSNYCLDVKLCLPIWNTWYTQSEPKRETRTIQKSFPGFYVSWDKVFDNPRFISVNNLVIAWNSTDYVARSYQFLNEYKTLFKMEHPEAELRLVSQYTDAKIEMTIVEFQQYVGSVPVIGGSLIFHFSKDGSLSSENGTYIPHISTIVTTPSITKEEAFAVTKKDFAEETDLKFTKEQLVIYDGAVFSQQSSDARLAWQFHISSAKGFMSYTYYIDAQTGSFIKRISDIIID